MLPRLLQPQQDRVWISAGCRTDRFAVFGGVGGKGAAPGNPLWLTAQFVKCLAVCRSLSGSVASSVSTS